MEDDPVLQERAETPEEPRLEMAEAKSREHEELARDEFDNSGTPPAESPQKTDVQCII